MVLRALSIATGTDADVVVKAGTGIYGGCVIYAAAADTLIKVYDSLTVTAQAATNMIDIVGIEVDTEGEGSTKSSTPCEPIKFTAGLTFLISGTGSLGAIWYK